MSSVDFIQGDCLEVMEGFSVGAVDVVVTSPPYNLGIEYRSGIDDSVSRGEYLQWTVRWLGEVHRILAEDGSLFLNIGGKPSDPWGPFEVASVARQYFRLQNSIYWVKSISVADQPCIGHVKPINSPRFVNDAVEHVLHLTKTGTVSIDRLAIGVPFADKSNLTRGGRGKDGDVRCRGNAWFVPYVTIKSRDADRPHPASFPPRLAEMCMRLHGVDRIRTTLDPFSGLGSTARASKKLGLDHIGIELSGEDIEDAKRLLAEDAA